MIYGIGCDLIDIQRVAKLYAKYAQKFVTRVLSPAEKNIFVTLTCEHRKASFLAKRFAAKEAFVKALGLGLRSGLSWQQISITRGELGQPILQCEGRATEHLQARNIVRCHVSLSDERHYAMAHVILEQE